MKIIQTIKNMFKAPEVHYRVNGPVVIDPSYKHKIHVR